MIVRLWEFDSPRPHKFSILRNDSGRACNGRIGLWTKCGPILWHQASLGRAPQRPDRSSRLPQRRSRRSASSVAANDSWSRLVATTSPEIPASQQAARASFGEHAVTRSARPPGDRTREPSAEPSTDPHPRRDDRRTASRQFLEERLQDGRYPRQGTLSRSRSWWDPCSPCSQTFRRRAVSLAFAERAASSRGVLVAYCDRV